MDENEPIQTGEKPVDEGTQEVEQDIGSPSETTESAQTEVVDKADEPADEIEYEPFRHVVKYKAADEDKEFVLEYDKDGNITSDTTQKLTQVLAKTGLEKVAQDKHNLWQGESKARELAEARVKFLENQMRARDEAYRKPLDFVRQTPAVVAAMKQRGIEVPDPERMKFEDDKAEFHAQKRETETHEFIGALAHNLRQQYPHLSNEHLDAVGSELNTTPLIRRLAQDPNVNYRDALADVLHEANLVVAKLVMDGKLPNPALDKARTETDKANKEVQSARETAKRLAAIHNPLAGGKPRGTGGGAPKSVDMKGWSPREAAAYHASGGKEIPVRLKK